VTFNHKDAIQDIKNRFNVQLYMSHKHIKRYIERLLLEDGDDIADIREMIEDEWRFRYRPDAFRIDRENREVHLYEVEDFHRMGINRLAHYYNFMDWLGNFGIESILHVFNRFGTETVFYTGDLLKPWFEYHNRGCVVT